MQYNIFEEIFMKKVLNKYVIDLSNKKKEPKWMLNFRLKALDKFVELDNPSSGIYQF